jgi:hypothetical protein
MEPSPHSTDSQPAIPLGAADVTPSRRRQHGQTGPRTARGKRRASLNGVRRGLCPPWVARDLLARGEDVKAFARLHRNLIAWLGPEDARTRVVVEGVAEAWWEKLRFARNWVGSGAPDTSSLDARIEELLGRYVWGMRARHRKWRYRINQALGRGVYSPKTLRVRLEERLPALGGKPAPKRRSRHASDSISESEDELLRQLLKVMWRTAAPEMARTVPPPATPGQENAPPPDSGPPNNESQINRLSAWLRRAIYGRDFRRSPKTRQAPDQQRTK